MKRLLLLALLSGFAFTLRAVEDNNPCKHPNLGKCEIELESSITAQVTLTPLEGGTSSGSEGESGSSTSQYKAVEIAPIVRGATKVKRKSLICPDCEEVIPCEIHVGNCTPGGAENRPGTYTGEVRIRCSAHNSSHSFPYSVTLKAPGGGIAPHQHDWGDWYYDCDVSSADDDFYCDYTGGSSLASFVLDAMDSTMKEKSAKVRSCKIEGCDEMESESFSHSARWICSASNSSSHIYHAAEEDAIEPDFVNGKHRYCVAVSGSCGSVHYISTGVWVKQTVGKLEVTSKTFGNTITGAIPSLPETEPDPVEQYLVPTYRPGTGDTPGRRKTVLKATPNFGSWDLNEVSWSVYSAPELNASLSRRTGSTGTADFYPISTGTYVVVARCNYDPQTDPKTQAKSVVIQAIDPTAIATFDVIPNSEGQKVIGSMDPCNVQTIKITFGAEMNGAPAGGKAILTIDEDRKTYELYKDPNAQLEANPADMEFTVTEETPHKDLYLLPLQDDSGSVRNTYTIKTRYLIGSSQTEADSAEDKVTVNWADCTGNSCSTPDVSARNSSVLVQGSLGRGSWGMSGGSFQIYGEKLNYRLLALQPLYQETGEDEDVTILAPQLNFAYGDGTTVKVAAEADESTGNGNVAGYPIRVCTGQYCTEFRYRKVTVGSFAFVDKMTVTQYLSSSMDASVAASGNPIAVTTIEMIHSATLPEDATEPEITALNVTNTQYSGGSSTSRTWSFTAPETGCPDLSGEYTISQLSENGVNNILVKQNYTANEIEYRRELRYIGSMTAPAAKEDHLYRKFDWGEEVVSETVNGATTTYEYYTEGDGKSRLKTVRYPKGNRVTYTYDTAGNIATETELQGSLSYVTSYDYAYDSTTKKRTITATRKVGETVISRNQTITYEERPNSNPDESISYDENNTAHVTKTWYIQGPNGVYDQRISRQENPDGTATVYTYTRTGSSETTKTESGVFNGNTLTLGTRQISIENSDGVNVSSETWFVDTAGNVEVKTASTVNSNFDEFGRAQTTTYLDGSTVTRTYGCCGVETETDRDGVVTTYAYDDFKRVSYTVRDGITTLYSYDALGNQTAVTIKGRNDGEITTESAYSNGELSSTTDAMGRVTGYTRTYTTSGTNTTYTETTTNPDNSTQITTSVNGAQTSVSGTAVHGQTMSYGANWQMTTTPVAGSVNMTVKSYSDMLGRNYKTEYADGSASINYYNTKNQVIKSVTPGGVTTLYEYDAIGRQTKQAIDMNDNGAIDAADLVTATAYSYGTQDNATVSITTQTRSQGSDSAVISIQKQSVDGLESWSTDLNGLTTHTELERLGNGVTRQTVTNPDGTKQVTNTLNGRTTSVQQINADGTSGNLVTYTYDEFNRVVQQQETAGGTTVNTVTMTYNANGAVLTQTVNGQTTSFEYDNMGRQTKVTAPGNVVTNTTYYPTGEVKRVDGATYPVEYTYNGLGMQATLKTFKDADTPQVTSWSYNNRGQMTAKTYADNSSVTYTYNGDGQLLTRTWARQVNGTPLVTTWSYDAAGRQTGYSYSDGVTPSVSMTLNFLDQPTSVTDAAGTRNFTYNSANQLANETIPGIVNGGLTYTYDTAGRRTAMSAGNGTTTFANAAYTYDAMGRIATVGNSADTLTYSYVPGTGMIASSSWQTATVNTAYTYDSYKRLTNIAVNSANVYGYTLNDKNQRTGATLPDGRTWSYSYDTLGQLTGAVKRDSANTQLADLSYLYDQIGNRTSATENNTTTTYTSNLVNQYTQIASQVPTYDADGNMTSYNGWTYTWNGENRLIAAENSDTRLEFSYDYMGRRLEKKVYSKGLLTLYDWSLEKHRKFVYDGYKLIAEFDALASDTQLASYLWQPESAGLDVPLMRIADNTETYYIADGNKNIIALKDSSGADVSTYTYTPFGALENPVDGDENPFRFSSEYADDETGLVYYNYRYYSPQLGRWTKRDPSEEKGGVNLYGMTENNLISLFDEIGLAVCTRLPDLEKETTVGYLARTSWVYRPKILTRLIHRKTSKFELKCEFTCTTQITYRKNVKHQIAYGTKTVEKHELGHIQIVEANALNLKNFFDAKNGKSYCGLSCRKAAVNLLNAVFSYYYTKASYENIEYDCYEYSQSAQRRIAAQRECQEARSKKQQLQRKLKELQTSVKEFNDMCINYE